MGSIFEKGNLLQKEQHISPFKPVVFDPVDASYEAENFYPVLHEKMSSLVDAVKEVSAPYFDDDLHEHAVFKVEPYNANLDETAMKDHFTRML